MTGQHRAGRPGPPGIELRRPDAADGGPPRHALHAPPAGRAVLACRCGVVLDLADLHRSGRSTGPRSGVRIEPIRCRRCAQPGV